MKRTIACCPHCGGVSGFFTKTTYVDVPYNRGWDGAEQDNSEMYDNVTKFVGGKMAYCQDCGKMVCRVETLEKQWESEG